MPTVKEILDERQHRYDYWREPRTRWNTLSEVYHGNYQKLWPGEFRRGEVAKTANWIKLAWQHYAVMVGKLPVSHVPPSKLRRVSQTKADKIEKILSHYDYISGMRKLARQYAWYLVGFGASCIGVMPDPTIKGPRIFVRDPRTILPSPGAGSVPTTSGSYGFLSKPDMTADSLHSVIIDENVTAQFLMDTYQDESGRLASMLKGSSLTTPQNLVTWMDKDYWCVIVNGIKLLEAETGLGFVPVRFTTNHVVDQLGGESLFEQNIGLMLAYMKTLNQKLTYNKNVVWPWLVLRGMNEMDHKNRVVTLLERDGTADFLRPPAELQIERDLEMLDRLIRVLNQDSEALQGESPTTSVATGSAVRELNRGVKNVVLDFWEIMGPDYEFVRSGALVLDAELYPGVTKPMFGRSRGEEFEEEYTPGKDIKDHTHVTADFGIGVGGMEGFVELMQTAAQGYVDEITVMEGLPWIKSVSETRRRVLLDKLEKILLAGLAEGLPAPVLNHLAAWHKAIEGGEEPYKWLMENPVPTPELLGGEGELTPGGPIPPGAAAPPGTPGGPPAPPSIPSAPNPRQLLALAQGRRA